MDKKLIIIILLVLIIPTVLIGSNIIANNTKAKTSPGFAIEECNTLSFNGKDKTSLVFFSNKELSEKYMNFFLETQPFEKYKEEFNFYYIDDYQPECELYKGIAILCYSKKLIKKASSCPNDYIIVLEKRSNEIRSSSYLNILSINTNHPLSVLTHEFGHSYMNLAEEYIPAKISKGSQNCVESCNEFNEEIDGCFEGCSESDYKRSIQNGVMRTLSSNSYGLFNENLIINKINKNSISSITGSVVLDEINCIEEEYYLIETEYIDENVNFINKTLEDGCFGDGGEGIFNYNLVRNDDTIILGTNFNPELIFTISPEGGEVFEYKGTFSLKIPAITNVKSLNIFENNNHLIEINLTEVGIKACKI